MASVNAPERPAIGATIPRFVRSLRLQLNILVLLFLVLPILLYSVFSADDRDRSRLAVDIVRDNGLLISTALKPELQAISPDRFAALQSVLARFASPRRSIELLYKPAALAGQQGFFYLAGIPQIPPAQLAAERSRLLSLGILDRLAQSCAGNTSLSERVVLPDQGTEILTSVSPVVTPQGCWVIVIAANARGAFLAVDDQAYWQRPAMRLALALYIAMALVALTIFFLVSNGARRLRETAAAVEQGGRFADGVAVPELMQIAGDFDRMVLRLKGTAAILKQAAEDNAHALKGPLAAIRQNIEPLDHGTLDLARLAAVRAAVMTSLERLDGLVQSARRLDTATAELLDARRHRVALSDLVMGFVAEYQLMLGDKATMLAAAIEPGIAILGEEDLIEVVIENLVDNALSFCPITGTVSITLARSGASAILSVADDGPGIAPVLLPKIFDRYFSHRPQAAARSGNAHYGIGLWLVRHHVEALNGTIEAQNRDEGGLLMTVTLPCIS